jgi:concanavalin A-like lectin/glucanase superfamily protein
MNADAVANLDVPALCAVRVARTLRRLAAVALLAVLAACSAGGGPGVTVNQPTGSATVDAYTGPPAQNADVLAFQINLWQNIIPSDRCGGCHHQGGQSPMFARSDDVNLAYQAALPLVNLTNPALSTLVVRVGSGHNCWVADPSACAATMLVWIQNWIGSGSSSTSTVQLIAPPVQAAGGGKQFPATASDGNPSFANSIYPLLTRFCSGCHSESSLTPQQPYFASANLAEAYVAAQPKIDLATPNQSRFYERLADDLHHCWATPSSGGAPDCPGSAAAMLAQLTAFANGIPVTPIDPSLVVSNALTLTQGTIAAGGSRYDANAIAIYMFETGQGSTAYDTSGVTPEADLQLSGNVSWVGGWGIQIGQGGQAQASTSASAKFASMIQGTGEYTFETWVAPANVTQAGAYIVSYSGSNTTRNATLAQDVMQYQAMTRSSVTDTNGSPPLVTTTAGGAAQAAMQHVVLTYDPVNGQKIYVNGVWTGDVDPAKGGSLANWDSTFALVLGNEVTGQRQFQGVIKFVAIHNRALTPAQIQQNFAAGVGQKYYLLFGVSALSGVPQSYILFQASQYDNYSYLFYQPKFISLDPTASVPPNLQISGIRIGVNGALAPAGQAFTSVAATVGGANYTAANGQLLSNLGTVVPVDLGAGQDLFFLSFDQLGSHVHAYVDPVVPVSPPAPNNAAQPDFGIATFERVNNSLARITGVPITNSVVWAQYQSEQQSMAATPLIAAFVSPNQTAMSQLANAYCGQLLANATYRDNFFGSGLDANLTSTAASFFAVAGNRAIVETALVNNAVGSNVTPQSAAAVTNEVDSLLQLVPTLAGYSNATVSTATQAACAATLGSAAVMLQ